MSLLNKYFDLITSDYLLLSTSRRRHPPFLFCRTYLIQQYKTITSYMCYLSLNFHVWCPNTLIPPRVWWAQQADRPKQIFAPHFQETSINALYEAVFIYDRWNFFMSHTKTFIMKTSVLLVAFPYNNNEIFFWQFWKLRRNISSQQQIERNGSRVFDKLYPVIKKRLPCIWEVV